MDALKPYLVGNARYMGYGRPEFYDALAKFVAANPFGKKISSLDRDVTRQTQLWEAALRKYGSPEAARKWVAPPGASKHNRGEAADLQYASAEARKWAHENAAAYGLTFPMRHEPWHVEPVGARTYRAPDAATAAQPGDASAVPYVGGDGRSFAVPGGGAPVAPMPPMPTPAPVAPAWAGALTDGLGGLGKAFAGTAQSLAPKQPARSGPVGLGGPELAPLAPVFASMADMPVVTPKSKTLAELFAGLSGVS